MVLESTTYPGTTRERLQPILEESGLDRRARLPPRLLSRADRPGAHRPHDPHDAEGRRRAHRGLPRPRGRALLGDLRRGRRRLHPRGGGDDEAAREHLPLGQHRARQRALGALRPDGDRRLGGGRRGGDQALRVHALRARAGDGRPLPARSTRSTSRSRRASTTSRPSSSSSPARSTSSSRITASSASCARSTTSASRRATRASCCSGVSYKAGVGDLREAPALKIAHLLRELGAEVAYHDPHVAEVDRARAELGRARRGARGAATSPAWSPRTTRSTTSSVVAEAPLVVDFRGVTRGIAADNLIRL